MSNALEVITRGVDSSGRTVRATRQAFQHFDRVNEAVGGKLVIVQGAFITGTDASAGTHDKAGCMDIRTWNLTSAERYTAIREARRLMAAAWYRTYPFDPHIHWVLNGDAPMASLAAAQIDMWKKGYNGLGWYEAKDDFPWRPSNITTYKYLEDDMFDADAEKKIHAKLDRILAQGQGEKTRDANQRERDKEWRKKVYSRLGTIVDQTGIAIDQAKDDATKAQLQSFKRQVMEVLKDDPDVDGVDNPSDEAMEEA